MTEPSIEIVFSAPGKLFLFGEYGVLGAGWSIVTAVNRRVRVSRNHQPSHYRVIGGEADLDLPLSVLSQLNLPAITAELFHCDVSEMNRDGIKLGLGSSAASAVALTAAALHGRASRPIDVFESSLRAHRQFQKGRGSGADVAASTFGGVLGYRLREREPLFPEPGSLQNGVIPAPEERIMELSSATLLPLEWPGGLRVEAFWVGKAASSVSLVGRVEEALGDNDARVEELLLQMMKTSREAMIQWQHGTVTEVVSRAADYDLLMTSLGEAIEADISVDAHRRLADRAGDFGFAAKPSGAGGGDVSLVFGDEEGDWYEFLRTLPESVQRLDLQFGSAGLEKQEP